jgi:hypothetical protein
MKEELTDKAEELKIVSWDVDKLIPDSGVLKVLCYAVHVRG